MKTGKITTISFLALALSTPAAITYAQGPPPGVYEQGPPPGFSDAGRQGFHEGVEAARHDIEDGRPPDPHRHHAYRHPDFRGHDRHEFREGFERGYHDAYERMRHHHDHDRDDYGPPRN